jgi:hypothetical protein
MPLAAAPYRASGLVLWHKTDMLGAAAKVRYRGKADLIRAGDPLGVNLTRIVGAAAAAARSAKANASVLAPTSVIS